MQPWLIWYLLIINIFTFFTAAWDKFMAKKGGWRVPEKTLFLLALVGGAAGLLFAMYTARHKTRKPAFKYGVPLILLLQVTVFVFLLQKGMLYA